MNPDKLHMFMVFMVSMDYKLNIDLLPLHV